MTADYNETARLSSTTELFSNPHPGSSVATGKRLQINYRDSINHFSITPLKHGVKDFMSSHTIQSIVIPTQPPQQFPVVDLYTWDQKYLSPP
jgi:hypothetical protein